MRPAALLAATVLTACGSAKSTPQPVAHRPPPRPVAQGPGIVEPAPGWVSSFCAAVPRRLLCPTVTPPDLEPLGETFRPGPDGYLLEGQSDRHWAVLALPARRFAAYGPFDRRGPFLRAGSGAGVIAGHLVLVVERGATTYAVAANGDDAKVRRQLRRVAAGLASRA